MKKIKGKTGKMGEVRKEVSAKVNRGRKGTMTLMMFEKP